MSKLRDEAEKAIKYYEDEFTIQQKGDCSGYAAPHKRVLILLDALDTVHKEAWDATDLALSLDKILETTTEAIKQAEEV